MCLASGPATEVLDAFGRLEDRGRLRVTLMDIDLQSLAYADEIRTTLRGSTCSPSAPGIRRLKAAGLTIPQLV